MKMDKKDKDRKREKGKEKYSLWSNYGYVFSNLWKYDKKLIQYGLLEIVFNVLMPLAGVIIPSIVFGLLDRGVGIQRFIQTIILVFLVYSFISAVNTYLVNRNQFQYINARVDIFQYYLYRKCLHMDYDKYEDIKGREELQKALHYVQTNLQGFENFIKQTVGLATNLLGTVAYVAIISYIHPAILWMLLLISAIQIIVFQRAKRYEHKKKEEIAKLEITQNYLQDLSFDVKSGKDIRLYQLSKLIKKVYYGANQKLKKIRGKIRGVYFANDMVGIILQFVRDLVCYGYLIYLLIHGLEVSYFVLFVGIVSGLSTWIMKIVENVGEISRENLRTCDYRSFLDYEDVFLHEGGKLLKNDEPALDIVFDHVSFRYNNSHEDVLEDVSFHIKKGDKFALVGTNGAGKSTIVKLMCGFYKPTSGRILINGIDITELNIDNYFKQIAVVFQDPFTLSVTIQENITATTKEESKQELLHKVLDLSGLKSKIDSLPNGSDTYLNKDMDESGIQLSGGELQKLMLARALYKNAKLLILDEPTAALDALAESELYEKYETLLEGKTALFISHRLASTRFCDHIIFLENGRIVEEGTHEDLMQLRGRYANMFEVQSQYYKEERKYETAEVME